jgi:hypothetical protein
LAKREENISLFFFFAGFVIPHEILRLFREGVEEEPNHTTGRKPVPL